MTANNKPHILPGIITLLILLVIAILAMVIQIIALNGVMDNRALVAMVILFISQGMVLFLGWKFAGYASRSLVTKFKLNYVLAIILTVLAAACLGAVASLVLIIVSILLAGIR